MMEEIKYHPLVDASTDGTDKVPMFFHTDRATVNARHDLYLEEIVPNYYRLYAKRSHTPVDAKAYHIHCPYCGAVMNAIASCINDHRLGLYACLNCNQPTK